MQGDLAVDLAIDLRESDGSGGLPVLTPVAVVAEHDVDQLVRTARAGVAMLSLQLRAARNDATAAELAVRPIAIESARELAQASLGAHLAERRRELAEELEQVRADAAFTVTAARTEAAELVAAASEETRRLLLAGLTPLTLDGPPSLRVVPAGGGAEALPGHPSLREAAEPQERTQPAHLAREVVVDPDPEPEGVAHTAAPEILLPVPPAVPAPASPPAASTLAPAALTAPVEVVAPTVPVTTVEGAAVEASERRGLSRFLYVDVVLPMIAVLVVLVVLLAWVG